MWSHTLLSLSTLGALLLAAGAPPSKPSAALPAPVAVQRIATDPADSWKAPQFVQANRKGNGFLLRGDNLRVYRIQPGKPLELEFSLADARPSPESILRAVLNAGGDEWLLFDGRAPHLYHGTKRRDLPTTDWSVRSVGFRGGTPVIGVGITMRRPAAAVARPPMTPPLVLEKRSDDWVSLVSEPLVEHGEAEDFHGAQITARDVLLLEGAEGRLWVANQYGYRLRQYSPGGRLLDEILVQDGKPQELPSAQAEEFRQALEKAAAQRGPGAVAVVISFRRSVQALALGLDGRPYLFVGATSDGKVASLDRFDTAERRLERVRIALPADTAEEIASMAALKDGLLLAPFSGDRGRYLIRWEDLEKADWKPVPETDVR